MQNIFTGKEQRSDFIFMKVTESGVIHNTRDSGLKFYPKKQRRVI